MDEAMRSALDPDRFRETAKKLADALADHLARMDARDGPVVPWVEPDAQVGAWEDSFEGGQDPIALFERVVRSSTHLHHPGFVGHQVTAPLPLTALADAVAALLNNGMAVYEMGPVSTAMERVVGRWMARKIGYPEGADGVFTSGGSLGNLTALLAARQKMARRLGFDAWHAGAHAGPPLAVLACEEAHYSTARAAQVMGWGEAGVVRVPADERFKMRADALLDGKRAAERAGRKVIGVVASACSTSTGAFDPLARVADFCEAHGLWMHVDGAHGAAFVLSPKHEGLLEGIARSDSVVWDAHKMLLCPALVTAVLFKDGRDSYAAFAQDASYLFSDDEPSPWSHGALRTLECTKRMLVLMPYAALAVYGERLFADYLDGIVDRTRAFAARLAATGLVEVAVPPECNIVCFRVEPGPADGDARQDRIRTQLVRDGAFYVVQTRLRGRTWLRATLINPRTTDRDLDRLIELVRTAAAASE